MDWGQEYLEAWNAHDADTFVARFAPEGVYNDLSLGISFAGEDALRDMHRMTIEAHPDYRWEHHGGFSDGTRYLVEWTYTATAPAGPHVARGCSVGSLDAAGRIVENHDYLVPPAP
jgi:ketosteroid isomerase-like protein